MEIFFFFSQKLLKGFLKPTSVEDRHVMVIGTGKICLTQKQNIKPEIRLIYYVTIGMDLAVDLAGLSRAGKSVFDGDREDTQYYGGV